MPLYEYRCVECEHLEEVLQKYNDPPPETCPSCGKTQTLSKEVSRSAFHLKGGGWYKDLYSSTKDGGKGADKSAGKAASDSKGDTGSAAKSGSSSKSESSSKSSSSSSSNSSGGSDKGGGGGGQKAA
jgi:putative FmdB family regulatory protein